MRQKTRSSLDVLLYLGNFYALTHEDIWINLYSYTLNTLEETFIECILFG